MMQNLTTEQVKAIESESESYRVEFEIGCRVGTFAVPEQVGTRMRSGPKKLVWSQNEGNPKPVQVHGPLTSKPILKNKIIERQFCSSIRFFVYKDQGQTHIYAIGVPIDMSTSMTADNGKTINHRWWPQVSGKEETSLIKEAYAYLSLLDSTREANNFGSSNSHKYFTTLRFTKPHPDLR